MPNQARAAQPRYYISRRIPFRVQGERLVSRLSRMLIPLASAVFVNLSLWLQPPSITLMHYL